MIAVRELKGIINMRFATRLFVSLLLASALLADGTVTTPANVSPTSWKIAAINIVTGSGSDLAGITIAVHYFATDTTTPVSTVSVNLVGAEITSFLAALSPPGVDTFSATAGAAKRSRQRASKWLIDNGKISNVTPEP